MRVVLVVVAFLALGLAGCTDAPAPAPPETGERKVGETLPADDPLSAYTWNGTNLIYDELEPPVPRTGTSWTYAAGGVWALTDEMTIIALRDDSGAPVFGAAAQEQLTNTAIWRQYWYGPMEDLNQRDIEAKPFDWPLFDGKVYGFGDLSMTAVAELIETPLGTLPGYRISGQNEHVAVTYTFVPEIGYLTSYSYGTPDGKEVWESLELTSVGTADTAWWLERGPYVGVGTRRAVLEEAPNATALPYDLPEGYDEVIFAGLGTPGAGVQARPPDPTAAGWGYHDADGFWDWQVGRLPATPGTWAMTAYQTGGSWAGFEAVAVRWVPLTA